MKFLDARTGKIVVPGEWVSGGKEVVYDFVGGVPTPTGEERDAYEDDYLILHADVFFASADVLVQRRDGGVTRVRAPVWWFTQWERWGRVVVIPS